jgi:hypothetical protein
VQQGGSPVNATQIYIYNGNTYPCTLFMNVHHLGYQDVHKIELIMLLPANETQISYFPVDNARVIYTKKV